MATFANRLKKLRKQKGMTQENLAKNFFITKSAISKYENGINTPENKLLQDMADFFEVTTDYILGRTDDPNSKNIEANVNGHHYEIEIDKSYPYDLSPEETVALIELLEEYEFNIDKLIEKAKNKNKNKNK